MERQDLWTLRAEVSLLVILRGEDEARCGASPLSEIRRRWPDFGLRASDLTEALARLKRRGLIRCVDQTTRETVLLTEAGARWSASLPAWLEYQLIVPRRSAHQNRRTTGNGLSRPLRDRRDAASERVHPLSRPIAA